jgi:hypothetical protein
MQHSLSAYPSWESFQSFRPPCHFASPSSFASGSHHLRSPLPGIRQQHSDRIRIQHQMQAFELLLAQTGHPHPSNYHRLPQHRLYLLPCCPHRSQGSVPGLARPPITWLAVTFIAKNQWIAYLDRLLGYILLSFANLFRIKRSLVDRFRFSFDFSRDGLVDRCLFNDWKLFHRSGFGEKRGIRRSILFLLQTKSFALLLLGSQEDFDCGS